MTETNISAPSGRKPWRTALLILGAIVGAGLAAGLAVLMIWRSEVPPVPDAESLWQMRRTPGMRFVDHQGVAIASRGAKYGRRVRLGELPPVVSRAFLAAEDRRFYRHGAVDPRGILRAAKRDLLTGRAAEGGSTLSQQLARTLFLGREHTLRRKVQEAILAGRLEDALGKDGVLELYLNRAYFGAGAYGLDSAARTYFGEGAESLTLPQAALLAAVVNAPTRLSPLNDMDAAWSRARRVISIMEQEGWVASADAEEAISAPPGLAPPSAGEGDWSYALDRAAGEAASLAGDTAQDLVVRLTVDSKLQAAGVSALRSGVAAARGRNVTQGALVALAPDGAIRAMVGGVGGGAFNRVTQAHRQPGSAFKAFVFGAAMEAGDRPDDTRNDAPIKLGNWSPENYGGHFSGKVTLAKALALSINSVAVRLTLEVGPATVASFARRCGLSGIPPDPQPSIALGAYEVTPLELATGYQVFQTGGQLTKPYLVEEVDNTAGHALFTHTPFAGGAAVDALTASRMVRMLEGVITSGTGTGAAIDRPAAGKTGTSQRWRDAWFVGFTPDLLTAVWVGNDNGAPMAHVTGGEVPAPIWRRFMTQAEAQTPVQQFAWLQDEPAPVPYDSLVDETDRGAVAVPRVLDEPPLDEPAEDVQPKPQPPQVEATPPPGDSGGGSRQPSNDPDSSPAPNTDPAPPPPKSPTDADLTPPSR